MGDGRDALERGRRAYTERAWADTYVSLTDADRAAPLGPEDELLAISAYMLGLEDESMRGFERSPRSLRRRGRDPARRALCSTLDG